MKISLPLLLLPLALTAMGQVKKTSVQHYTTSRAPLRQNPYLELPSGAIKPDGYFSP